MAIVEQVGLIKATQINFIQDITKLKKNIQYFHWFQSYGDVKWWIAFGLILPSGGVPSRRVCYQQGYIALSSLDYFQLLIYKAKNKH